MYNYNLVNFILIPIYFVIKSLKLTCVTKIAGILT